MDNPVRVKVAFRDFYAAQAMTSVWTHIRVNVKNISFDKKVKLHYKGDDGLWHDFDLTFANHFGNFDVFRDFSSPPCKEFVVKYVVNDTEFWDNNSFGNYKIDTYSGCVGGNVMLKKAVARRREEGLGTDTCWLEGEIYVFNKSYHKRVGIRYTGSNWLHSEDVNASYAGLERGAASDIAGVEIWKFRTPQYNYYQPYGVIPTFKFAVYYEILDPGEFYHTIFWDNNFGQDYELSKVHGTTIGE